jgi:hypothetical protein
MKKIDYSKTCDIATKVAIFNRETNPKKIEILYNDFINFSINKADYITYIAILNNIIPYKMKNEFITFIQNEIIQMLRCPHRDEYVYKYEEYALNAWNIRQSIIDIVG